ncbi:major facilitator superfamily domain-containing protein [Sporodiniella umbellata]|nr:major facilitator superfamily domain-containing protein [Sporodiniella umbellata]
MREITDYKSDVVVLDNMKETSNDKLKLELQKITRIIDLRLMPLICVFYFMDYLDRANMGNASLAGIQDDLKLTSIQFSLAVSGFYITYILFEVPSNIILKRTGAVKWLSFIIFVWGVTTLAMSFTRDFAGLFTCRLFLGASESGFIPGILFLLSKVYKPNQITWRTAIFLCMASVSGIVSGPIAYATSFLDGDRGLKSWQYLFIIEGVPTICLSAISYFYLFDDISQVSWLTQEQKDIHQSQVETNRTHSKASIRTIIKACLDWKTFMFASTYCLSSTISTSYQVFAPIIIDGFGFPVLTSQLLTAPPHALQVFIILFGGYMADKLKNIRGKLMAVGFFTTSLGYILLQVIENRWGKFLYCIKKTKISIQANMVHYLLFPWDLDCKVSASIEMVCTQCINPIM